MSKPFDIRESDKVKKDSDVDKQLRPLSFDDFQGQKSILENLKIFARDFP